MSHSRQDPDPGETADRPRRVGVAPANAQLILVPAGGERHAEALGANWDSSLLAHWL